MSTVEERLEESELRLNLALQAARIGIWDWDLVTGEMNFSQRAREIFGFGSGQPVTIEMVRDTMHPDDVLAMEARSRRALDPELRSDEPFEYRINRTDTGEERWLLGHGQAVFSHGGNEPVRFLGTVEDITERKRSQQELLDFRVTRDLANAAAQMAVWDLELEGERVTITPELKRLFGFAPDANPSLDEIRSHYAPGERERIREVAQEAFAAGETQVSIEFRIIRLDGEERWMLLRAQILTDADGKPHRVIGILMDIDDRKRTEEEQVLLTRELAHRVKNSLAVAMSIATQTFRHTEDKDAALSAFQGRIQALAFANDVLVEEDWRGFSLHTLIERVTSPYRGKHDPIAVDGPDARLPATTNVPLALTLHELCTNAAKYGALSQPSGTITIDIARDRSGLEIRWQERGGPKVTADEAGFGTRLMKKMLASRFRDFELEMEPEGVRCRIAI
jgi:PAS domain S-box-containing protein